MPEVKNAAGTTMWVPEREPPKQRLPYAFITCNSGGGEYSVQLKTTTLRDAQMWHDAVLRLAAEGK